MRGRCTRGQENGAEEPSSDSHKHSVPTNKLESARKLNLSVGVESVDAARPEIVVLPLLTIRDHGRTCGLELLDGIPQLR
jgi:hypothetical protein